MEVRTVDPGKSELCAALGAIVVKAYASVPGYVPEPDYELELADVASRAAAPHTEVVAALDGGEPLGCVTYAASPASPLAELIEGAEAGFRMLAVDPSAQGRGVGRVLVEACIDRARAGDRTALCLHSTPWMTVAHRLYESLGFERDPARDWTPVPRIPLLAFRLRLQ